MRRNRLYSHFASRRWAQKVDPSPSRIVRKVSIVYAKEACTTALKGEKTVLPPKKFILWNQPGGMKDGKPTILPPQLANKQCFADLNEEQQEQYISALVKWYQKRGFPYRVMSEEARQRDLERLLLSDYVSKINENEKLIHRPVSGQYSGNRLCWSFMLHADHVVCGSCPCAPADLVLLKYEEKLKTCFRGILTYGKGRRVTVSTARKAMSHFGHMQSVSNFPPVIAAAIYHRFGGKGGVVWDMSGGWGGRLLGAYASGVKHYIATEPSTKTHHGLQQIADRYCRKGTKIIQQEKIVKECPPMKVDIHQCGSEEFLPKKQSLDLCFTSPPYFNTEKYSEEETQSWKKFPTQEVWLNGFMKKTLQNCHRGLKPGKYCVINIANNPTYPSVVNDIVTLAKSLGFQYVGSWKMELQAMVGYKKVKPEVAASMHTLHWSGADYTNVLNSEMRKRITKRLSQLPNGKQREAETAAFRTLTQFARQRKKSNVIWKLKQAPVGKHKHKFEPILIFKTVSS